MFLRSGKGGTGAGSGRKLRKARMGRGMKPETQTLGLRGFPSGVDRTDLWVVLCLKNTGEGWDTRRTGAALSAPGKVGDTVQWDGRDLRRGPQNTLSEGSQLDLWSSHLKFIYPA